MMTSETMVTTANKERIGKYRMVEVEFVGSDDTVIDGELGISGRPAED